MGYLNEEYTRQSDLISMDKLDKKIVIIGAGAIGGWTSLSLAKMGFLNQVVIDFDKVDTVNLSSQLFRYKDIGSTKVAALQSIITEFTNKQIEVICNKYENEIVNADILVMAVDSMEVRSKIWKANKKMGLVKMMIDPRMGSEMALLYVMNPNDAKDIETYEKTLYTDDNALSEPCTRKSTQYCALTLSGLICAQVKSLVNDLPYQRITQFDIPKGAYQSYTKV